jgi:hypothetical protein
VRKISRLLHLKCCDVEKLGVTTQIENSFVNENIIQITKFIYIDVIGIRKTENTISQAKTPYRRKEI